MSSLSPHVETAVFGGGCFWCTEAVFQTLRGVTSVTSGYAGGNTDNPTYDEVSSGDTNHAEVIRIEFDPKQISYSDLLTVFFASHDPTTLNRQGSDVGTQYRSVIFYTSEKQKREAEASIENLKSDGIAIVTEVAPLDTFTKAEDYHQGYYQTNSTAPYCQIVIAPKIEKVQKKFEKLLKTHKE